MQASIARAARLAALVGALAPGAVMAQGSSVYTQSACVSGRAGTGVARPCADGSAIFYNPAGVAVLPGALGAGVTWIRTSTTFTYDSTGPYGNRPSAKRGPETTPVPHVYLTLRTGARSGFGLGVWAPYGLGLKWDPSFEGRYTGYDNGLRGIYVQPTAAVQLVPNRLAVGVGADFVRGSIHVRRRADAPQLGLDGTDVADVNLEGDGHGVTGHVGLWWRAAPWLDVGARYLHSAKVDMDGRADFTQLPTGTPFDALLAPQFAAGGRFEDQRVRTSLTFPPQFVVGVAVRARPRVAVLFDYQWIGWSTFDTLKVDFEKDQTPDENVALNYRDASAYRLGVEADLTPTFQLRGGFLYNTAATPRATPLLPEGERNYLTVGFGYRYTPRLHLDAVYQYIRQEDRRGSVRPGGPEVGVYQADASVFGFTVTYRLGGTGN